MSKRDNRAAHHRAAPPVTSPQESRARVESLIASGKTREALDLAKQWFKETRSAEAEALVIAAYEARIGAMLAQGLYADATAGRGRPAAPAGDRGDPDAGAERPAPARRGRCPGCRPSPAAWRAGGV